MSEFQVDDRVFVAYDATTVRGYISNTLYNLRGKMARVSAVLDTYGNVHVTYASTRKPTHYAEVDPRFLNLVSDPKPDPTKAVLDRLAKQKTVGGPIGFNAEEAKVILSLIPKEHFRKPLPIKAGSVIQDDTGRRFFLTRDGTWLPIIARHGRSSTGLHNLLDGHEWEVL